MNLLSVKLIVILFFTSLLNVIANTPLLQKKKTYKVNVALNNNKLVFPESFGAKGDNRTNDADAFRAAMKFLKTHGGGTLQLRKNVTYFIDFPNISQNKFTQSIQVPPFTMILGTGASKIRWKVLKQHICFDFFNAPNSGIQNVDLIYSGVLPSTHENGDYNLFNAIHNSKMPINGDNFCSWINLIGSDHFVLKNLNFYSSTQSTDSCIAFCIRLYPHLDSTHTIGGSIRNIKFKDYQMGILLSGQKNLLIDNLDGDRRTAKTSYPPGHIIYTTWIFNNMYNENITISNITDSKYIYPNTRKTGNIGTLSLKYIKDSYIKNIYSQHPDGIIKSFQNASNLDLNNINWSGSDTSLVNIFYSATDTVQNVHFSNVHLKNTTGPLLAYTASSTTITQNITFKDILIESSGNYYKSFGMFLLRGHDNQIQNLTWKINRNDSTKAQMFIIDGQSTRNNIIQAKITGKNSKLTNKRVVAGENSTIKVIMDNKP